MIRHPPSPYAGSGLLAAFLERNGLRLRPAAKALGVSKTSLIFWLRGEQRPRDPMREAIAKWTGGEVPVDSWDAPNEVRPADRVQPFGSETTPEPR